MKTLMGPRKGGYGQGQKGDRKRKRDGREKARALAPTLSTTQVCVVDDQAPFLQEESRKDRF